MMVKFFEILACFFVSFPAVCAVLILVFGIVEAIRGWRDI